MGKLLGKCKGEEVAEMVGVRTRARAALAMAAATNKNPITRKVSTTTSFNVHHTHLRKRRKSTVAPENCPSETTTEGKENCSCMGQVCSDFPVSCCSSNKAMSERDVVEDRFEIIADPEVIESAETSPRCFNHNRTARAETTPGVTKSDGQYSPLRSTPDLKSTVQVKMPSDSEIEDFFTAAQKDIHKRFTDKYNFDIVKDIPLEGRYEWVQIKP